jgi:hypothetical protein
VSAQIFFSGSFLGLVSTGGFFCLGEAFFRVFLTGG